jgi:hypothetical protein
MKLVKSLLLGSAAGLAAVAGAQAADLPIKKAAPVDYVRVCSTYGAGYFYIPGTDTCLRINGFVDGEYQYNSQERGRDDFDVSGFRARFRLQFDARQPTEYGLLRAFIRMDLRRESGVYVSGGETGVSATVLGSSGAVTDVSRMPDQAYIQWGGFTAGRSSSFYDFWTGPDLLTKMRLNSDVQTALFGYTFSFGGGLSATVSVEDPGERRNFVNPLAIPTGFVAPGFIGTTSTAGVVNAFAPEGIEWPDLVGNVRVDQAWGAAQLSGAIHDLSAINTFAPALPGGGFGTVGRPDDEIGWAIQGGLNFKLPFIAPGDELFLQANYTEGATGYAGSSGSGFGGTLNRYTAVRNPFSDAFVDQFGNVQKTIAWQVGGQFRHYWASNLRSNFFLSTINYEFGNGGAREAFLTGAATTPGTGVIVGFPDVRVWEGGANLIWTPVKQLDIGVEAVYRKFDVKGGAVADPFSGGTVGAAGIFTAPTGSAIRRVSEDDAIEARFRVRREF